MLYRKKKSYNLHGDVQGDVFKVSHNSPTPTSDKINSNDVKRHCWTPFLGVFYAFLSSVTILLTSVFVKKLSYIDSGQLSLVRNIGVLFGNIPIAVYCTKNAFGSRKYFWLLIIRSFLGATALYLNLMAYRLLPLTETSIILSSVPALVTVAARVHLKEPCGLAQVVSIILSVLGVLMSVRLPKVLHDRSDVHFDREYVTGLSCATGSVLILAFTFVTLRKMKDIHFSTVLLYFGSLGSLENAVITYFSAEFKWPRCEVLDRAEVIMIGVFGFMGHCFLTLAVQKEAVGVVSTSKSASDIVVSAIFQFIFFNSIPDYYALGGGLLVITAISSLGLWKWLLTQPEDSVYRKKLKFLLL
ncbi:solute carrier family 35 member G1-like [Parasteatoda tepidariorum]|uniref:solute carrier family 35 member G1-like n=1 Tax=Parasteatoda tepidariorum TaxID=114398 RepID=UPI001C71B5CB|nr:solute carrier family 35 member G1-like [Parasteatoda tepidariorum]